MKKIFTLFAMTCALGFSWAHAENQNSEDMSLRADHAQECNADSNPNSQPICWSPKECPAGYDSNPAYCSDEVTATYHMCGYECRSTYLQH